MTVIYCYLEKEKYKFFKFHVNNSADSEEEKHPSIKADTVICFKCFHVCKKIFVCMRWTENCDLLSKRTLSQILQGS